MSYVPLHIMSCYSLLNSSVRIDRLIQRAKQEGFEAIAITDENVMYGAVDFYKACKEKGIKPIIGITLSVIEDIDETSSSQLLLLAEDYQGYVNLMKLSSIVQTKSKNGVPKKWLKHYAKGLFAILPATTCELIHVLDEKETFLQRTKFYFDVFTKEKVYLGMERHSQEAHHITEKLLVRYSFQTVALNKVHYLQKEDVFSYECLKAIKRGEPLEDFPKDAPFYLKSSDEMYETFSDCLEALENTILLSRNCNVEIKFNQRLLPKYPIENDMSAEIFLEELCVQGLNKRVKNVNNHYKNRLQYELNVIRKTGFSDYFLIVWDFMLFARQNNILTGPGRGSAAGSLVAYCLYITNVDPIQHNLLFERFLNPERVSMPDIDIDFQDNRRDEVIHYVTNKYGSLHVAQIITFGTLAAKASWRDVSKALRLSVKEIDGISKLIPSKPGTTLESAFTEVDAFRRAVTETKERQRAFEVAKQLEGIPRHTSTHAAGVIISENPLTELIPIQQSTQETYLTQYPMETLENIGLLKMDFLGLRNLTIIQTIKSLVQKADLKIEEPIPPNDEATFALLSEGDTSGIFQLESPGMRKVLLNLKPNSLEDIVAVNALYRPGPMEQIPLFIERKHGVKPIEYPHEDLIPILKNTYGVIVYQEQIMQIASALAGFSLGEADLLRRAVGKKKKEVLAEERQHFVKGCLKNGYDEKTANHIYDLIVRFADYGFNRSHAVAYSMIAYELAYLKANFPIQFMSAFMSSIIGNEQKISQYVNEAKRKGIRVLPPSINKSAFSFLTDKDGIRFSLLAIKGVGRQIVRYIVEERKKQPYTDLFDLSVRTSSKLNRRLLEQLIYAGALDEFNEDRATLLASIDVAMQHAELVTPTTDEDQMGLMLEVEFDIKPKYVKVEPMPLIQKLELEKEALGFYLSNHPVEMLESYFKLAGTTNIENALFSKGYVKLGVLIVGGRTIRTKKGEQMAFLTLSDQSGDLEAVVFPDVFSRFTTQFKQGEIVLLEGKIESRNEKDQLIVKNILSSNQIIQQYEHLRGKVFLKIDEAKQSSTILQDLKSVLNKNRGPVEVYVHYVKNKKTIRLPEEDFIMPTDKCLQHLEQLLGTQNVVFKKDVPLQ
ncbi:MULTISPECIES: DNA polymerase III subunit alpha [Bacillus]|uniref:DNA polymerase III subunit alpha n=1 Tax=Bacillus TaxID=1386 RepID=UPI000BB6DD42|nr:MULTISPECIES: DNA polymerase III subunit alpha [Bacillus]